MWMDFTKAVVCNCHCCKMTFAPVTISSMHCSDITDVTYLIVCLLVLNGAQCLELCLSQSYFSLTSLRCIVSSLQILVFALQCFMGDAKHKCHCPHNSNCNLYALKCCEGVLCSCFIVLREMLCIYLITTEQSEMKVSTLSLEMIHRKSHHGDFCSLVNTVILQKTSWCWYTLPS